MKAWISQLAGVVAVLLFVGIVGGLVLLLRAQQSGLGASMAAAHIRAISPPDGATNVPVSGELSVEYISRTGQDPAIKFEPPVNVQVSPATWEGTTYVLPYRGLRDNSLYHVELDQDDGTSKGEHKQIKLRWSFHTGSATRPTATPQAPSPTAVPSVGQQLIWYHGPYTDMHAVDWNGKPVKTRSDSQAGQSPDGAFLWHRFAPYPGDRPPGTITDANGTVIGSVPGYQQMMWADDGAQFCAIGQAASGGFELVLITLDGKQHTVGPIVLPTAPPQAPALAACSDLSQQTLIVGQSSGYVWSLTLVSLRDGSVIYQRPYPNPVARLVASHDGQLVAEQLGGNAVSSPATLIRQLPSGTQLGKISGIVVEGFSWDGSLVAGGMAGNASIQEARVIRWKTEEIVWKTCTCPNPSSVHVLAQPGGTKLVVIAGWNHDLDVLISIVDSNGTATTLNPDHTPITPAF